MYEMVRPPAAAGGFYPDDPELLRIVVEDFLGEAKSAAAALPKALIVPHAGYIYSGPVAAAAYALLVRAGAAGRVTRVVLIGPSHYVPFDGLALPCVDAFATPLGRVRIDRAAVAALCELPSAYLADGPHVEEHALEVQLPFLQAVLGDFALVPIAAGSARAEAVAGAIERVWGGRETLIVVSSDLSHYHDHDTARRLDSATAAAIEAGDGARIGPEDACGQVGIAGLLALAPRRGLSVERLALATSADTAGPRHRVVGYGAWAFYDSTG